MNPGASLWSHIQNGISWRWLLWRRQRFLLNHFQNGRDLATAYREKQPCGLAVCRDGTRLTHPAERTGFVSALVEVWHDQAYIPRGFYRPANSDVVIDVGANVGLFTIWLARQNPHCRILALEPFAENFAHLRANVAAAHAHLATAHQLALGGVSRMGAMVSVGSRSLDHRLSTDGSRTEAGQKTTVINFDELLALAATDRVAFLKMDIEGAEYEVFEHFRREQLLRIDRLAIEYHEHMRAGTRVLLETRLQPTHQVTVQADRSGLYGMIFAALRKEFSD